MAMQLSKSLCVLSLIIIPEGNVISAFTANPTTQQKSLLVKCTESKSNCGGVVRKDLRLQAKRNSEENDFAFLSPPREKSSSSSSSRSLFSASFGSEAVPENQRPTNEYQELIRSPLFDWATDETGDKGLGVRLLVTYAAFFGIICWPIAGATFVMDGYGLQKFTAANVGSLAVIFALLVRLYTGWGYIGARLKSKVIEYEETGWYDGAVEEKTKTELARDLMLYRKDVAPAENRVKSFTAGVGALLLVSCLALNFSVKAKPIFNEYDPALLQQLRADDFAADVAARESGSRPTYCGNRYYTAVANGGQGCE